MTLFSCKDAFLFLIISYVFVFFDVSPSTDVTQCGCSACQRRRWLCVHEPPKLKDWLKNSKSFCWFEYVLFLKKKLKDIILLQVYAVYSRNKKLITILGSICLLANIGAMTIAVVFRPDCEINWLILLALANLFLPLTQLLEHLLFTHSPVAHLDLSQAPLAILSSPKCSPNSPCAPAWFIKRGPCTEITPRPRCWKYLLKTG